MENNHDIDELFRKGVHKDYQYDNELWDALQPELDQFNRKPFFWNFNLNSITLIVALLFSVFLSSDTSIKSIASSVPADNNEKLETTAILKPIATSTKVDLRNENAHLIRSEQQEVEPFHSENLTQEAQRLNSEEVVVNSTSPSMRESETESISSTKDESLANRIEKQVATKMDQLVFIPLIKNGYVLFSDSVFGEPFSKNANQDSEKFKQLFKQKKHYFEVELNHSILLNKEISSSSNDFETYKRNSEQTLHQRGFGLNYLTDFKSFTVGFGLHINQYKERVNYIVDRENIRLETSYDTNYRIVNNSYNSNGNQVILIERQIETTQNRITEIEVENLIIENQFTRLQLPVFVGYQRNFNRVFVGVRASAVANYLLNQKGYYINENLTTVSELTTENQLNEFVFSQRNQLSLGYLINETILVGGRFSYEYDLNSYTKNYNSRFQSQNLGIWLQWKPK